MTKELLLEMVRNFKDENDYTIKLCAEIFGANESQLGYYLRGQREMTDKDAALIAEYFGEEFKTNGFVPAEKVKKNRIKMTAKQLNDTTIGITFDAPLRLYYKMLDECEELGFSDMAKYVRQHFIMYFSKEAESEAEQQ